MPERLVYAFTDGTAQMRELLGGKGANLAEMTRLGLPVPPGFTITTVACRDYYRSGGKLPQGLLDQVGAALQGLEAVTGKGFGDPANPLLVSVRSGAAVSMPGMMDTILNLGLNDATAEGLARLTQDRRFALDCYRRFIQMFSDVVMGLDLGRFEGILAKARAAEGVADDHQLSAGSLQGVVAGYLREVAAAGRKFPQDPLEQLRLAVEAVFRSWNTERAKVYRRSQRIPDDLGTAVNIQAMVFGNTGSDSGTGVVFTRDPSTGRPGIYGEFLVNAQGEDVVAGIRTPMPIAGMAEALPGSYLRLLDLCELLEEHYGDMQDIEFTVEGGQLFLLQTRTGKRTAAAALRLAVDFVSERRIEPEQALRRVDPAQLETVLHRGIDPQAKVNVVARGLPASPGAASGLAVFEADAAEARAAAGYKVILVRPETTPDDIHGIVAAQGVLTSRGGMTCHAAIVARHMGKPCVVGCDALVIDAGAGSCACGEVVVREGDLISIDGATGRVILGAVPLVEPELSEDYRVLLGWADAARGLGVRANADTPADALKARQFGAEGIGLCRTEHMFMAPDRLPVVQEMILAEDAAGRGKALARLLPMQRGDFEGILEAMDGLPVTIRLLDPPLHEFLPNAEELSLEIQELRHRGRPAAEVAQREALLKRVRALAEFNPMLGLRGCRLGLVYPEIYAMQARAVFAATVNLLKRGRDPQPEVMIPLVGMRTELEQTRDAILTVMRDVFDKAGVERHVPVGTMIELPRAALVADEIAELAEFFSYGTNDLTQTTFGFSRDDAEAKFMHRYLDLKLLSANPFATLDERGVGRLMLMGVELGRKARPGLKVGICGEHGGDPASIDFCHRIGLDYVSCSPYRVPVARLAAAQAKLKHG
ncbi:MAG: pyruvate, phosphate dikinase [Bacillota bacterium]